MRPAPITAMRSMFSPLKVLSTSKNLDHGDTEYTEKTQPALPNAFPYDLSAMGFLRALRVSVVHEVAFLTPRHRAFAIGLESTSKSSQEEQDENGAAYDGAGPGSLPVRTEHRNRRQERAF